MDHLDKTAHHLLTSREVGNHAVAQWANGTYVVVGLFIHHLGFLADRDHLASTAVKGDDRRLIDHDLVIADDDGVGSAQVHRYLLNERKHSHLISCFYILYFLIDVSTTWFSAERQTTHG